MSDSIDDLKKAVVAISYSSKDKKLVDELVEKTVESFLWANGIVCSVKLDYVDDSFPS